MTWKINAQKVKTMNKKFSVEDKLNLLFQCASINEIEVSRFCREKGIYPSTLEKWKQACLENIDNRQEKREKIKTKDLQVRKKNMEKGRDYSRDNGTTTKLSLLHLNRDI